ncbi:MAG: hypothetical protein AB7O62_02040 [Pirellulales bacterium]
MNEIDAKDKVADELRRLIAHNQEMESRLQALQLSVAGMRADFEQVIAARMRELQVVHTDEDVAVGIM